MSNNNNGNCSRYFYESKSLSRSSEWIDRPVSEEFDSNLFHSKSEKNLTTEHIYDQCTFKEQVDVKGYKPEEITVSIDGNWVTVEGEHEEVFSGLGSEKRRFRNSFRLPNNVDKSKMHCVFRKRDALLEIKAPYHSEFSRHKVHIIPMKVHKNTVDNEAVPPNASTEKKVKRVTFADMHSDSDYSIPKPININDNQMDIQKFNSKLVPTADRYLDEKTAFMSLGTTPPLKPVIVRSVLHVTPSEVTTPDVRSWRSNLFATPKWNDDFEYIDTENLITPADTTDDELESDQQELNQKKTATAGKSTFYY